MAAGGTFEPIATANPTSGSSYTFSSIPNTYTDLVLVCSVVASATCTIRIKFNGSNSNYFTGFYFDSGSVSKSNSEGQIYVVDNDGAVVSNTYIDILNYSENSLAGKTVLYKSSDQTYNWIGGATWQVQNTISSIEITTGGIRTYSSGTRFTLYGIARA